MRRLRICICQIKCVNVLEIFCLTCFSQLKIWTAFKAFLKPTQFSFEFSEKIRTLSIKQISSKSSAIRRVLIRIKNSQQSLLKSFQLFSTLELSRTSSLILQTGLQFSRLFKELSQQLTSLSNLKKLQSLKTLSSIFYSKTLTICSKMTRETKGTRSWSKKSQKSRKREILLSLIRKRKLNQERAYSRHLDFLWTQVNRRLLVRIFLQKK